MKKIIISQRIDTIESYNETRDSLDVNWSKLLTEMNYIPIPIPSNCDIISFIKTIKPNGFLLTGGNDLSLFNDTKHSILRDIVEKTILDYAIEFNIPTIGVCRGAQFIAHYFGGKLQKSESHIRNKHLILNQSDSKLHPYFSDSMHVNSYHNYCIFVLPENIFSCAIARRFYH